MKCWSKWEVKYYRSHMFNSCLAIVMSFVNSKSKKKTVMALGNNNYIDIRQVNALDCTLFSKILWNLYIIGVYHQYFVWKVWKSLPINYHHGYISDMENRIFITPMCTIAFYENILQVYSIRVSDKLKSQYQSFFVKALCHLGILIL